MLDAKATRYCGSVRAAATLASVGRPSGSDSAPLITKYSGPPRKTSRYSGERDQAEQRASPATGARRSRVRARPAGASEQVRSSPDSARVALAQVWATTCCAASVCACVGNCGSPVTGGSAATSALSAVPASVIASSRTGRALPASQRFWPSSE